MKKLTRYCACAGVAVAMLASAPIGQTRGDEFGAHTPYYEDDAWYDVSEWLDGNDYNPTDESFGRWDDEIYNSSAADSDGDNDADNDDGQDDSWRDDDSLYSSNNRRSSYYSDVNSQDIYTYRWDYFDYDRDGYYDAMTRSYDSDNDGAYDAFASYTFSDAYENAADRSNQQTAQTKDNDATSSENSHAQSGQKDRAGSKSAKVSGVVKSSKKVNVRGGMERLVAEITTDDGATRMVDLGPADELKTEIRAGQKMVVHGPQIKVGKHHVVVAHRATLGDQQEQQINRSGRKLSGKVAKVHRAKVRGEEHQMALLDLDSGKQALIDLGNADSLGVQLSENDQIELRGVPVKVNDRLVVIANSITKDGERTKIQRIASKDGEPSSS